MNELSAQYKTAAELNQKIIIAAQMAQQNLYSMCCMLKEMRDGKIYKELGYQNFEDYCENEVGFGRMQAHKYIAIIENVKNVNSSLHFGVTKLALLSSLSESQQEEIQEKIKVEDVSVRELKEEIKKLKDDKEAAEKKAQDELESRIHLQSDVLSLKSKNRSLSHELEESNEKIQELESQPVEVAVQDNPETLRQIDELNQKLFDETIKSKREKRKNDELEERIKTAEQELSDLRDINKMQEQRIRNSELEKVSPDTKEVFRAYYQHSVQSMDVLLSFIREAKSKNDINFEFFRKKLDNLTEKFAENLHKIWEAE